MPQPAGPPPWSRTSIIAAGVVATVVATFALGTLFTWPFALMVGVCLAVLTVAMAAGVENP